MVSFSISYLYLMLPSRMTADFTIQDVQREKAIHCFGLLYCALKTAVVIMFDHFDTMHTLPARA